jgi:hypothetical protein
MSHTLGRTGVRHQISPFELSHRTTLDTVDATVEALAVSSELGEVGGVSAKPLIHDRPRLPTIG